MWKIKNIIFTIFHPSFWMNGSPISYTYDETIRRAIQDYNDGLVSIRVTGEYTILLGGLCIWVGCYPYNFGHLVDANSASPFVDDTVLPAPLTAKELRGILEGMRMNGTYKMVDNIRVWLG